MNACHMRANMAAVWQRMLQMNDMGVVAVENEPGAMCAPGS